MQQHPVPQHIASYEFRLIGDMTLKQFGMLAVCAVMSLLFYASGLPGYFKWPLVLFFLILGVSLAFIPIEERPMHQWLMAFFKAVYSPTQFIWHKAPQKMALFEAGPKVKKDADRETKTETKIDTSQLQDYLQSLPREKSQVDQEEENVLDRLGTLFESAPSWQTTLAPSPPTPRPLVKDDLPSPKPPLPVKPVKKAPVVDTPPPPPPPPAPNLPDMAYSATVYQPLTDKQKKVVEAKTSSKLPIPQAPKTPNLPVGMVLDPEGNLIENAILEIRDQKGLPVRALKTNSLGQFRIVTPLENGVYEIETEKEGLEFDIINLTLTGQPVPPLEIKSKGNINPAGLNENESFSSQTV